MKKFKFPLGRLERVRELKRRQARAILADAIAEMRALSKKRDAEKTQWEEGLSAELPEALADDPRAWKQMAAWREHRRSCLGEAETSREEAATVVRDKLTTHAAASRDHRVIERLREKRYRRWLQEAELEERRFLDETHLQRLVRKRRNKNKLD